MPKREAIDHEGRRLFLLASEKVTWRGRASPLAALRADVFPHYRNLFDALSGKGGAAAIRAIRAEFDVPFSALSKNPRPEAGTALSALRAWADQYGFVDDWICEAAHHTVRGWFTPFANLSQWHPVHAVVPPAIPNIGRWEPDAMAWADYLRYATGAITHYLVNVYKPQVLAHYQDHKSSSPIHARWTALHIAGKSFAQIAAEETRRNSHVGGRSVTRQAVQKAIRGFAVRTRITLPSVN